MHYLFGHVIEKKTIPLGVPYMGSKRKYADKLINRMLEIKPNAKYFYDLFGGGGAMSFAALQKGMTVFYNEKQTDLVDLIRYIFERKERGDYGFFPNEFYKFVTREEFHEKKPQSGVYPQFVRVCYSFGNNQRTYMFNPEIERMKHLAHDAVVFKDGDALEKLNAVLGCEIKISDSALLHDRRLDFRRQVMKSERLDLEQLERLPQLELLQQLERLQQLEHNITFTNFDYRDVKIETPINETIVYLDPPYRGTTKYLEDFDYSAIDSFFGGLPYLAFMSEYNAPFESVLRIETRSTFNSTTNSTKRVEKLFINR